MKQLFFNQLIFAQTSGGGTGQLKTGLQTAAGIIMAILFIYGILIVAGGVSKIQQGDTTGKMSIVAGVVLAASVAIMTALYAAFGLSSSAISPSGF